MEKEDFRKISYEGELQRAKWFKEDLEKGTSIKVIQEQTKENLSKKEFERKQNKIDSAFFRAVHTCAGTGAWVTAKNSVVFALRVLQLLHFTLFKTILKHEFSSVYEAVQDFPRTNKNGVCTGTRCQLSGLNSRVGT